MVDFCRPVTYSGIYYIIGEVFISFDNLTKCLIRRILRSSFHNQYPVYMHGRVTNMLLINERYKFLRREI